MKTSLEVLIESGKREKLEIIKTSVPIYAEDIAFLDAAAKVLGTTRSKLITRAINFACSADYVSLETSNPEVLEKIVNLAEESSSSPNGDTTEFYKVGKESFSTRFAAAYHADFDIEDLSEMPK